MKEIEQKTLQNALRLLDSLGCAYAVIDPDGQMHGTLKLAEPEKKKKAPARYPHGSVSNHVRQYLSKMTDNILVVPVAEFDIDVIQSTVCSILGKEWGEGSYHTSRTKDNSSVEIIKLIQPKPKLFGDKFQQVFGDLT
jgi:hypothetical protein